MAREGLSLVFDVDGFDAVTVAAPGTLLSSSDGLDALTLLGHGTLGSSSDDVDEDREGAITGEDVLAEEDEGEEEHGGRRRFLRDDGRSGLQSPREAFERGEEKGGSGGIGRRHLRQNTDMTTLATTTTAAAAPSVEWEGGRDGGEDRGGVPPRDMRGYHRAALRTVGSRGVGSGRRRRVGTGTARELQEEEEEGEGGDDIVNVEFEVLLPAGEGGSGTASSRFAAVIDAYADVDGRMVLADALGVSTANVRCVGIACFVSVCVVWCFCATRLLGGIREWLTMPWGCHAF